MIDKIAVALNVNTHVLLSSEESELSPGLKRLIYNAKQLSPELLESINAIIEAIINNK